MAPTPVIIMTLIISTLVFEGMLFGDELPESQFPSFEQPESGGFWGALDIIAAVIKSIWAGIIFFINLITFNVPGAPWYVRTLAGTVLGGGLIWSIVTLIRGGGGD